MTFISQNLFSQLFRQGKTVPPNKTQSLLCNMPMLSLIQISFLSDLNNTVNKLVSFCAFPPPYFSVLHLYSLSQCSESRLVLCRLVLSMIYSFCHDFSFRAFLSVSVSPTMWRIGKGCIWKYAQPGAYRA